VTEPERLSASTSNPVPFTNSKLTLLDEVLAIQSPVGAPATVTRPLCVFTKRPPRTPCNVMALDPVSTSTLPAASNAAPMSPLLVRARNEERRREPVNELLVVVTAIGPEMLPAVTAPEPEDI
jgi:hypothetical protein